MKRIAACKGHCYVATWLFYMTNVVKRFLDYRPRGFMKLGIAQ